MKTLTFPKTITKISSPNKIDSSIESIYILSETLTINLEQNPFDQLTEHCTVYAYSKEVEKYLQGKIGTAYLKFIDSTLHHSLKRLLGGEEHSVLKSTDSDHVLYELDREKRTASLISIPKDIADVYHTPLTVEMDGIVFPVTTIQSCCLGDTSNAKEVVIEANVTTIEENAFKDQKNIETIRIKGKLYDSNSKKLNIGNNAFKGMHEYFKLWIDDEETYNHVVAVRDQLTDTSASIEFFRIYDVGDIEKDKKDQQLHRDSFGIGYELQEKKSEAICHPFFTSWWGFVVSDVHTGFSDKKNYTFPHAVRYKGKDYIVRTIKGYHLTNPCLACEKMWGCSAKQINHVSGFTGWVENQKVEQITIPGTVKKITAGTFNYWYLNIGVRDRSHLTTINIAKYGLLEIEDYCFAYQNGMNNFEIPKTVVSVGRKAFHSNDQMRKWVFPKGVSDFKEDVFGQVSSISGCKFKNNVKEISIELESAKDLKIHENWFGALGSGVVFCFKSNDVYTHFSQQKKWKSQWSKNHKLLASEKTNLATSYTYELEYDDEKQEQVAYLTGIDGTLTNNHVDIPAWIFVNDIESVRVVGLKDTLFSKYHSQIESVTMPDTIETVEEGVFNDMEKMENIILSSRLQKLPNNIFKDSPLKSLYIPSSIKEIGANIVQSKNLQHVLIHTEPYLSPDTENENTLESGQLQNNYLGGLLNSLDKGGFLSQLQKDNILTVFSDPNLANHSSHTKKEVMSISDSLGSDHSQSGEYDSFGLKYSYNDQSETATVIDAIVLDDTNPIITIPKYVYNEDSNQFYSVTTIEKHAFMKIDINFSLVIQAMISNVDALMFSKIPCITSIVFEENVEEIGDYSFSECPKLDRVQFIGDCKKLKKSVFDDSPVKDSGVLVSHYSHLKIFQDLNIKTILPVTKEEQYYTDGIAKYTVNGKEATFVDVISEDTTDYVIPNKLQYFDDQNQEIIYEVISVVSI